MWRIDTWTVESVEVGIDWTASGPDILFITISRHNSHRCSKNIVFPAEVKTWQALKLTFLCSDTEVNGQYHVIVFVCS
jgi:hypothetical protein